MIEKNNCLIKKIIFSFSIILVILGVKIEDIQAQPIESGKITKKIKCLHDSEQSYALYLPSDYSANKKWPIIFAFDPGARATIPLQHFKNNCIS